MQQIYTIGYGNRSWEVVLQLLEERHCQFLIDVRSNPYSKFNPSFCSDSLSRLCENVGMRYVPMGPQLGGKPTTAEHFDADGKVNYLRLAQASGFKEGLERLITAVNKQVCTCIMCSELRPHECHRCKLIGAELTRRGVEVIHIDEHGKDITQEEAITHLTGGQVDMFGNDPSVTRSRGAYK